MFSLWLVAEFLQVRCSLSEQRLTTSNIKRQASEQSGRTFSSHRQHGRHLSAVAFGPLDSAHSRSTLATSSSPSSPVGRNCKLRASLDLGICFCFRFRFSFSCWAYSDIRISNKDSVCFLHFNEIQSMLIRQQCYNCDNTTIVIESIGINLSSRLLTNGCKTLETNAVSAVCVETPEYLQKQFLSL